MMHCLCLASGLCWIFFLLDKTFVYYLETVHLLDIFFEFDLFTTFVQQVVMFRVKMGPKSTEKF